VPSRQRHRAGLYHEIIAVARRLDANLGVCWTQTNQTERSSGGRSVTSKRTRRSGRLAREVATTSYDGLSQFSGEGGQMILPGWFRVVQAG
jgi:hypothetical protein